MELLKLYIISCIKNNINIDEDIYKYIEESKKTKEILDYIKRNGECQN